MTRWQNDAACRGMNLGLFFPDQGEKSAHAKRICARCPVAEQCRAFADQFDTYGVFGGQVWKNGRVWTPEAAAPRKAGGQKNQQYPAETRDRAIALYLELRAEHRSDRATCNTVATRLGVRSPVSVQTWVAAAVPSHVRQADGGAKRGADRRNAALRLLHTIRKQYPTQNAAVNEVARIVGVSGPTVYGWLREAEVDQRAQLGEAA